MTKSLVGVLSPSSRSRLPIHHTISCNRPPSPSSRLQPRSLSWHAPNSQHPPSDQPKQDTKPNHELIKELTHLHPPTKPKHHRSSSDEPPPGDPSSTWTNGVAAQAIVGSLGGVIILGFGGYVDHF